MTEQSVRLQIAEQVGGRLRDLRSEKGLSQERLAGRAELSRETVRLAEAGVRVPSFETLAKLAEVLGVSLWDLMPTRPDASFSSAPRIAGAIKRRAA